ncbi:MAG: zinc ribbon domain-containing protein [Candidatus Methanomethylophilaceae archaeon]|nr:zinc ribbon domain-containing protein [Candidatus Methanomethylophilaceae archaeon]
MKYVCPECGSQIPDDSDFCHVCGCLKSKAYAFNDDFSKDGVCPRCGSEVRPGRCSAKSAGRR